MSDDEDVVPDEPLDVLVDAVDEDTREETRRPAGPTWPSTWVRSPGFRCCHARRSRRWPAASGPVTSRPKRG